MSVDFTTFPATLDALHLLLAVLASVFVILFFVRGKAKPSIPEPVASPAPAAAAEPAPVAPPPAPVLKEATPDAALQLLALLQQEARFVDFVNEDLAGHSDADIGAVARVVHDGAKKTIQEYFSMSPIRTEEEESRVTVQDGFNAAEIRLTGNVVGQAPFSGTLVHRGWKVTSVKLPKLADGHDTSIVAAAEVEL